MKTALILTLLTGALAAAPVAFSAEGGVAGDGQQAPPPVELPGEIPVELPKEKKDKEKPERPESPGQERKDAVTVLVEDFRSKVEEYKNSQQDLLKKFKGASAEERARIREQIKEIKEQFREAKDQFQSEMKASPKLSDDLKRVVDIKDQRPGTDGGASRE